MLEGVRKSWNQIFADRKAMLQRFREEFGHEPQGEVMPHHFGDVKEQILHELDEGAKGGHLDPNKTDSAIDNIVGKQPRLTKKVLNGVFDELKKTGTLTPKPLKRGRGRPKGSKNKPKPQLVNPSMIGSVPDLIINTRALDK